MKTLKRILATALLLALPVMVFAQDEETITRQNVPGTSIWKYTVAWVASLTATKDSVTIPDINKYLFLVVTDPDAVTPPIDDYDLTITDERGLNVMGLESGANPLADVDIANTEDWVPKLGTLVYGARFIDGDVTIAFTNIGTASCEGEIVLYTLAP